MNINDRDQIVHGGIVIGRVEQQAPTLAEPDGGTATLVLNLGWMKAAGVGVRVLGDPEVDRNRTGVVLERPAS